MGVTAAYSAKATISTTEYSLPNAANYSSGSPITADVVGQIWLDLGALAAGDDYTLNIYEKVDGGTQRLVDSFSFKDAQAKAIVVLPAFLLMDGWDVSMIKNAGTDRSIRWSIRAPA